MTLSRLQFLAAIACSMLTLTGVAMHPPQPARSAKTAPQTETTLKSNCSSWMLEGFNLGMQRDALLAVRPVTFAVTDEGRAFETFKFKGSLWLDGKNRLQEWYVIYDAADGDGVRAAMKTKFGEPIADVSGNIIEDEKDVLFEKRTIWWSTQCDAAMVIYEDTPLKGTLGHHVSVRLARPSRLPAGIDKWKTLSK